jgi:hypothetical protein
MRRPPKAHRPGEAPRAPHADLGEHVPLPGIPARDAAYRHAGHQPNALQPEDDRPVARVRPAAAAQADARAVVVDPPPGDHVGDRCRSRRRKSPVAWPRVVARGRTDSSEAVNAAREARDEVHIADPPRTGCVSGREPAEEANVEPGRAAIRVADHGDVKGVPELDEGRIRKAPRHFARARGRSDRVEVAVQDEGRYGRIARARRIGWIRSPRRGPVEATPEPPRSRRPSRRRH